MRRLLAVGLVLVGVQACRSSAPPAYNPAPAVHCYDGPPICGADQRSVVQCQRGSWVLLQSCPGARGCGIANNMIQCDAAPMATQPQAPVGVGIPCAAEGGYDCTPDRRNLTICRGGRTAIASTCRGSRGCNVGNAVDCDHSMALVGDPCDGPKEIACSQDSRSLLRCTNGVYQVGEPCRNACLSTSGRVLCQ
jgi:hypothetical protein